MLNLNLLETSVLGVAAVGQLLFLLLYGTFPWWRSFLGRALFVKALTVAILLSVWEAGRFFDWTHEEGTFALLGALVCVGIWGQVFAFLGVMLTQNRDN